MSRYDSFADELHLKAWPAFMVKPHIRRPLTLGFVVAALCLHYLLGPNARLAAVYVLPILVCAWYDGFVCGVMLGTAIVLTRLSMRLFWPEVPWSWWMDFMNSGISEGCILFVCWWAARGGQLSREVHVLRGLLPICMHCHRIRNASDHWERIEVVIAQKSEADFTHGICPTCRDERYPRT